uniref:NMDA receptor synaptonuclear signaling and neuronal migration factor a n=1 Tax=Gadus morhua TaxID=8049 RepID=A0A8C5BJ28_GADMO
MGTAVSKRKNLRNDAISSVAAKVRAARAFGEYLSHPENPNGSAHLLCETLVAPDTCESSTDTPRRLDNNNHLHHHLKLRPDGSARPARLSLERSFSAEEDQQKGLQCTLRPARVYTITPPHGMLMSSARGSKESLELEVLKERPGGRGEPHLNLNAGLGHGASQHTLTVGGGGGSHHGAHGHHGHHLSQPLLQTSVSAHNIRGWGEGGGEGGGGGMAGDQASVGGSGAPSRSQGSLDLESSSREAGKQRGGEGGEMGSWFPKENMFSFQTASTTMQANFRKHLRMVGSRRMKAQTFAERRSKSFNRSWSDPTPVKADSPNDTGDLQASCAALEEGALDERMDWEEEREMERLACEGDDFIPPKIMLISSKVPKAEYVPTILRRDDPSIIPILYANMFICCMDGPGHLYLLKNKVATFAKVEKEEDMSQFWRRLSRFMSKLNPEPNMIHIMGCYVLGNPNGEKLFQKLKNLMRPYSVEFQSPLELSSHGKEMIEMYFDFRLYRLWKTRQHSKLLDYEDLL